MEQKLSGNIYRLRSERRLSQEALAAVTVRTFRRGRKK